jgi:hypothetical protein
VESSLDPIVRVKAMIRGKATEDWTYRRANQTGERGRPMGMRRRILTSLRMLESMLATVHRRSEELTVHGSPSQTHGGRSKTSWLLQAL